LAYGGGVIRQTRPPPTTLSGQGRRHTPGDGKGGTAWGGADTDLRRGVPRTNHIRRYRHRQAFQCCRSSRGSTAMWEAGEHAPEEKRKAVPTWLVFPTGVRLCGKVVGVFLMRRQTGRPVPRLGSLYPYSLSYTCTLLFISCRTTKNGGPGLPELRLGHKWKKKWASCPQLVDPEVHQRDTEKTNTRSVSGRFFRRFPFEIGEGTTPGVPVEA